MIFQYEVGVSMIDDAYQYGGCTNTILVMSFFIFLMQDW